MKIQPALRTKVYFFSLTIFLCTTNALSAGTYVINKDNITQTSETGLVIAYESGASIVPTGSGFHTNNLGIYLRNFQIKPGQKWTTMSVTFISAGGNVDFQLIDSKSKVSGISLGVCVAVCTKSGNFSSYIDASDPNITLRIKVNNTDEIQKIEMNYEGESSVVAYPSPYEISQGSISFAYDQPENAEVTLIVYDSSGRVVRTIYDRTFQSARRSPKASATWNGRNDSGIMVSSGVYTVYVDVKFVGGSGSVSDYTSSFRFAAIR